MDLVSSTCLMIHMIMNLDSSEKEIQRLEAIIRMFLIHFNIVDSTEEKKIPSWISQYNMLCLLNLPTIIRTYGSMRNVWEGGMEGEAYLKNVKKNLKCGLVNRWQGWVITNLLREEIFSNWKTNICRVDCNIRNHVRVYGSSQKVYDLYKKNIPMSAMRYEDNYYICYKQNGTIYATEINLSNKKIVQFDQIYYTVAWKETIIKVEKSMYQCIGILFLPKVVDSVNMFCVIQENWSYGK
jgi:hypothetical protein